MSTEYQHAQPEDDAADSSECESSDDDEEDPAEALKRTMEELKDYEASYILSNNNVPIKDSMIHAMWLTASTAFYWIDMYKR